MRKLSIHSRLNLLIIISSVILFCVIFVWYHSQQNLALTLAKNSRDERSAIIKNMLEIESKQFNAFVSFDYSLWDEMCVFTRTQNVAWALNSIDSTLVLYDFNAAWVLNSTGAVVYSISKPPFLHAEIAPILPSISSMLHSTQQVTHFFTVSSNLVTEIRAATIHPTLDNSRSTTPQGVFVCARAWDATRLKKLSTSLGCPVKIEIADHSADPVFNTSKKLIIKHPLVDSHGSVLASLCFVQNTPAISTFIQELNSFVYGSLFATLVLFGFLLKYIYTTMSKPLALIEQSLRENTPQHVKSLANSPTEFSSIAAVIEKFFAQREELSLAKEHAELVNQLLQTADVEIKRSRAMDVHVAAHIQQNLLLSDVPVGLHNLTVFARSTASQRVDGDFYDFLSHGDQILDVVVGDVMGKGIPAALLGAATKNIIARSTQRLSESCMSLPSPAEIINAAHSIITPELISLDSFVTCSFARFNCTRNMLSFVDCGHTRTIHYRNAEGVCDMLKGFNVPLGFIAAETYDQVTLPFDPGDVFLFYSDGITEAKNDAGVLFGEQRLINTVYQAVGSKAEDIARQVFDAACAFSGHAVQQDDMSCVVVCIGESARSHVLNQEKIELTSSLDMLARTRNFLSDFTAGIPSFAFGEQTLLCVELALHEALTNVINYAYRDQVDGRITIQLQLFPDDLFIILCHWGSPFNPDTVCSPSFDGSRDNGFGMYIINQCLDEIHYLFGDSGRNLIVMRKQLYLTNHSGEASMDISCDTSNAIPVIRVNSEVLDASNTTDFKQKIAPMLESHTNLILDLSAITFVDSSGLGSLLAALRMLNSKDGDLKLFGLSKQMRVLFELVRMQHVFAIFSSQEEALRAFSD